MTEIRETLKALDTPGKWLLSILGFLILFGTITQLALSLYFDCVLGQRLREQVQASTKGECRLKYEDLDLSLTGRSIELKKVHLLPDTAGDQSDSLSTSYPVKGEFRVETLRIGGVGFWNYLVNDELTISLVLLQQPRLSANLLRNPKNRSSQSFSSIDSSLYALISGRFSALQLDDFEIQNGSFDVIGQDDNQPIISLGKLNLQLQDMRVDSSSVSSDRMFITDNIELEAEGFTMSLMQGLYTLKLPRLKLSSTNQKIEADSLQLIPLLPRHEFAQAYGKQTDRIDLLIPAIEFDQTDFTQLADSGRFYATTLSVDRSQLDIFHDMNIPFDSLRSPPLPQLAFKNLTVPVKIEEVHVTDTDISYTEHQKDVPEPGTATFDDLQATIKSLSNYTEDLRNGHQTTLKAQTNVMDQSLLSVYFAFQMDSPQGKHSIDGKLDTIAFSQFNPALENLAFIRIDQGKVNSLEFSMDLNSEKAKGSVTLDYKNLEIEMLNSETLEQGTGQEIKSFIANTFVVQENNNEDPLREGEINFERDKQKSIFNFWWKSLSTGLKNSIGL